MFAALYRLISTDETPSSVSLHALGFEPQFDVDRDDEKSRRQTSEEVDELGGKPIKRTTSLLINQRGLTGPSHCISSVKEPLLSAAMRIYCWTFHHLTQLMMNLMVCHLM